MLSGLKYNKTENDKNKQWLLQLTPLHSYKAILLLSEDTKTKDQLGFGDPSQLPTSRQSKISLQPLVPCCVLNSIKGNCRGRRKSKNRDKQFHFTL